RSIDGRNVTQDRSLRDLKRCGHQSLGPLRRLGQLDHLQNIPFRKVKNEYRLGSASGMRVGIKAVVEDSKLCESRHQLNQMDATPIVAVPNPFFWDFVSASGHPGSNPRYVQFGTTQSHEPHAHVDSSRQRFV